MQSSDIATIVLRAERLGHTRVIFVCYRAKEPRQTVTLLPGVPGVVVGTERDGARIKVTAMANVCDVRRWYERTVAHLPDDMPDHELGIVSHET
jgi:hypothetical protein